MAELLSFEGRSSEGSRWDSNGVMERILAEKIRDGAGAACSSLSGESAYTHQGAKDGVAGCCVVVEFLDYKKRNMAYMGHPRPSKSKM